jgi:hypothetical protein
MGPKIAGLREILGGPRSAYLSLITHERSQINSIPGTPRANLGFLGQRGGALFPNAKLSPGRMRGTPLHHAASRQAGDSNAVRVAALRCRAIDFAIGIGNQSPRGEPLEHRLNRGG